MKNRAGYSGPLQSMLAPIAGTTEAAAAYKAVTGTSGEINGTGLAVTELAVFTCDVDCYIAQGAAPTAAPADGSMFVPAGMPILIDGLQGAKVAVVAKSTTGVCTLAKLVIVY